MNTTPEPDGSEPAFDPAIVTYLRRLVTILSVVMIGGFLILVGVFVSTFNRIAPDIDATPGLPDLPDTIRLPEGTEAVAFTRGEDWFAVVTGDNRIIIFDTQTGAVQQVVTLDIDGN